MKRILLFVTLAFAVVSPMVAVGATTSTYAVITGPAAAAKCERRFLTFPTWFRGMSQIDDKGNCGVVSPSGDLSGFIWRIILNIIEIVLQVVGYIAFFFLIYGGFQYMTGGANPTQLEQARQTILNAVIGFGISLTAVGLVNLVFGIIG